MLPQNSSILRRQVGKNPLSKWFLLLRAREQKYLERFRASKCTKACHEIGSRRHCHTFIGVKIGVLFQSQSRCSNFRTYNNRITRVRANDTKHKPHIANPIESDLVPNGSTYPNEFAHLFDLNDVPTDEKTAWFSEKPSTSTVCYTQHTRYHHLKYNKTKMKSHFVLMGFYAGNKTTLLR